MIRKISFFALLFVLSLLFYQCTMTGNNFAYLKVKNADSDTSYKIIEVSLINKNNTEIKISEDTMLSGDDATYIVDTGFYKVQVKWQDNKDRVFFISSDDYFNFSERTCICINAYHDKVEEGEKDV